MLQNLAIKIKDWIIVNKSDLYVAAIIFLTATASFGLGRLSAVWPEKEPILIDQTGQVDQSTDPDGLGENADNFSKRSDSSSSPVSSAEGRYVASKSGTAYHFPWCPGALKIKEENKIWFDTVEDAEKLGYKPAGNCEGL